MRPMTLAELRMYILIHGKNNPTCIRVLTYRSIVSSLSLPLFPSHFFPSLLFSSLSLSLSVSLSLALSHSLYPVMVSMVCCARYSGASKAFMSWQLVHGRSFVFARTDWEYVLNTFSFGYAIGYHFIASDKGSCNGNFLGIGMIIFHFSSKKKKTLNPTLLCPPSLL